MDASSMERVDALWFPDGNIVLCAHGVLFRVFRGILAARSPVFADMLAFPQPEDAETLDGCPVLHLDDSAADAMYFLKALFDYEFFAPYPAKTDFDAIHGVLRLGTKYRVGPLRRRALEHLASAHPMRLGEWDALCGGVLSLTTPVITTTVPATSASAASSASSLLLPSAGSSTISTISTIMTTAYAGPSFDYSHLELPILTLARAAGAAWVLPAAFLRAAAALTSGASLSSLDVLEGIDYTGVHVELERGDKVCFLSFCFLFFGRRGVRGSDAMGGAMRWEARMSASLWSLVCIPPSFARSLSHPRRCDDAAPALDYRGSGCAHVRPCGRGPGGDGDEAEDGRRPRLWTVSSRALGRAREDVNVWGMRSRLGPVSGPIAPPQRRKGAVFSPSFTSSFSP
ncbi:hypothetical protein C8R46DRAFT_983838 [Mycena filopes]|nr:hypothetical protein C8R46DRAFT_983838 [Mycena filopes]